MLKKRYPLISYPLIHGSMLSLQKKTGWRVRSNSSNFHPSESNTTKARGILGWHRFGRKSRFQWHLSSLSRNSNFFGPKRVTFLGWTGCFFCWPYRVWDVMRHKGCLTDFFVETKINFEFQVCVLRLFLLKAPPTCSLHPKKSQRLPNLYLP